MGSDFILEFREDHIYVELGPDYEITPDTQDEFWRQLREACESHDSRRVIVEGFVPKGERNAVEVAEAGKRTGAIPNLWLAFRLKNFTPNEKSELFEAVAASKGVRVKFFSDSETALTWLRRNAPR